jgi:RNA polymerase sigma-70 factor (ECF subfamily)
VRLFDASAHDLDVEMQAVAIPEARATSGSPLARSSSSREATFSRIYEAWFHEVTRWIRALGGPDADLEDLAQEVFVVVERKLDGFDGRNLPAWLYRIAARTVSVHRRRAWFRRIFLRPRDVGLDDLEHGALSPAELLERQEAHRIVYGLLARMSDKRRRAFALFEIEGYSGEEIAALEGIPLKTAWSRLGLARKDFLRLAEELRTKGVV